MSDKPGAGKTYVVLALIYFAVKYFKSKGANIIVVPHNIYTQWVTSIKKLLGVKLTYKLLLEYSDINILYTNPSMLYDYDIILTTSLYYDSFASTIKTMNLNVRRVFFDEADTIQNLLAHPMPSAMTWFISASINRVFDKKTNLAQIGTYKLHLSQLLNNECCCSPEFIDDNIKLDPPNIDLLKCRDFYLDKILTTVLTNQYLPYINGHDYSNIRTLCNNATLKDTKDVVINLYLNSVKNINDINLRIVDIDKKIKYSYSAEDNLKYNKQKEEEINKKKTFEIMANNIKLLTIDYNLCIKCFKKLKLKENVNSNTFKLDYYEFECKTFICNQCYHKELENELLINPDIDISKIKFKCSNCSNTHLTSTLKFHTEDYIPDTTIQNDNLNKTIILEKILDIVGDKVIIYSQFRGVSNFIKSIINNYNYSFVQLDGGNINDLEIFLQKFKNDKNVKILLIDDTSFGIGLNIEYATDIIFFNYIEPKLKTQLIGRAQRFGRTCTLNIWELLYTNEIH
jgi:hypothetical protein